jgi:nucleoside-diphosphate-sugar epimerase
LPIAPTGQSFPGDTPRWYADISKVSALGFAPRVDLDDGLRRTIAWLRDTR